jgi:hypothetical protein
MTAILKAPADLLWFGGIGTYVKASHEVHAEVGDPSNDSIRVNGADVRARVIGEGGNLAAPRPGASTMRCAAPMVSAGAATPTSSTIRPASIARTRRSTSRSRWPAPSAPGASTRMAASSCSRR